MKSASLLFSKLFLLAKQGQRDKFLELARNNNILENTQMLSPKEIAILIFGYNKLRLADKRIQSRLEALYLAHSKQMNVHDHIMCGSSLKHSHNQTLKSQLVSELQQRWSEIEDMQSMSPNIGLVAYLASQTSSSNHEIWRMIEATFQSTIDYQDERNFMTVLYAFSKVKPSSQDIWLQFERFVWAKGFLSFSDRNKTLIVYSFSKAKQGSQQFWEQSTKVIKTVEFNTAEDIQFSAWAFAKAKQNEKALWNHLIDQCVKKWKTASTSDIEIIAYSLRSVLPSDLDLWRKFCNNSLDQLKSQSIKYSLLDDVCKIAQHLLKVGQSDSALFRSLQSKFRLIIREKDFALFELRRLYEIVDLLQEEPLDVQQSIVTMVLNQLVGNQNLDPSLEDRTYKYLSSMCDLVRLVKTLHVEEPKTLELVLAIYKQLNIKALTNDEQRFLFVGIGWHLIPDDPSVLNVMADRQIYEESKNNVSLINYLIKVLYRYEEGKPFFEWLKQFVHSKADVFVQLVFYMLHKNCQLVPQSNYKLFLNSMKKMHRDYESNGTLLELQSQVIDFILKPSQSCFEEFQKKYKIDLSMFTEPFDPATQIELKEEIRLQLERRLRLHETSQLLTQDNAQLDMLHFREKRIE